VPFLVFLKSFEVLLFEIMSWIVFYPRTLWRAVRHPLSMMDRSEVELKLPAEQQFRDIISPPIFLLLTVVAAHAFEVAVVGNSPLIDNGIGLAALIQDNTSLILFRLIAFSSLPVIADESCVIASDIPRTATASAASAPAARAALTRRSARSVSAVRSRREAAGASIGELSQESKAGARDRDQRHGPDNGAVQPSNEQFARSRQHLVNHGSQRGVNHASRRRGRYHRLTQNFKRIRTRFCHV